jgi:uncharacterized protein (DUF2147 family)
MMIIRRWTVQSKSPRPERLAVALCIALAVLQTLAFAQPSLAAAQDSPVGDWVTLDDETGEAKSVVRIWEEGGKLNGRIIRLVTDPTKDPNPLCTECEGERKNQPIVGMVILNDFTRDGKEWSGGTVLDPENGQTYRSVIRLAEDMSALDVRGFIGIRLIGRTQRWVRAK